MTNVDQPGGDAADDAVVQGELAALERLRQRLPLPAGSEVWLGDDAAVIDPPVGRLALAVDTVVAGVHADLALTGLDDLGWKAVAVNLSDLAAMGATPHRCVVAVTLPPGTDLDLLYEGVAGAAGAHGCPVVGGDLTSGPVLVVTVTVAGRCPERPVLRSGARPGDALVVTGPLGRSAAGLAALRAGAGRHPADPLVAGLVHAHARPEPRLAAGSVANRTGATAMLDLSDGLALDAHRLGLASGVGVALVDVPVADGVAAWVDDPEEAALGGGEDFELLVATDDPAALSAAFAAAGLSEPLVVGRCTADPGERTLRGRPLVGAGFEHRW